MGWNPRVRTTFEPPIFSGVFVSISYFRTEYHNWRGECRSMSPAQAIAKWAEAEAEFKSVESQLYADTDCFYEIEMERLFEREDFAAFEPGTLNICFEDILRLVLLLMFE